MIKFFRRIRFDLMEKNKTRKYLKYAIGEIGLVVIGILIALQINTWNELRKERQSEIKYFQSLKLDLETDLVNLDFIMEDRQKKGSSAVQLLSLEPPKSVAQLKVFDSLLGNVFGWTSFTPRTNTLDELISSGSLNKIKNDSVKLYLLSNREKNEKITLYRAHMRREYEQYLYDPSTSILVYGAFVDFEKSYAQRKNIRTELTDEQQLEYITGADLFLKDKVIRNGLRLAIWNNLGLYQTSSLLKADVEKLINFIDEDINGNKD